MKKLTQDEYKHYKRQSYWTYNECISIMIGIHFDSIAFHRITDGKIILKLSRGNPHYKKLNKQIEELVETMDRSIGNDLIPREDMLNLAVLGADDPTFVPKLFLEWTRKKRFTIPYELNLYSTEDDNVVTTTNDANLSSSYATKIVFKSMLERPYEPKRKHHFLKMRLKAQIEQNELQFKKKYFLQSILKGNLPIKRKFPFVC